MLMIRMMSAAVAMLALLASGASAADLVEATGELVPEEPPQIPVFSWTGFYAGVHAGYGIGRDEASVRTRSGEKNFDVDPNGVIGGIHAGYNRALSKLGDHALVVGVEGDIDAADDRRTTTMSGALAGSTIAVQSDIKGSIRARTGVAAGRVLYFATGGAAFADFDTSFSRVGMFGQGAPGSYQRVQAGYTVGGGVEYAFLNYVSVRAEYRYTDYDRFNDPTVGGPAGSTANVTRRDSDNRLQAGLSYRFD